MELRSDLSENSVIIEDVNEDDKEQQESDDIHTQ